MGRAEDCLEEVVDKLLKRALRRQQPGQVDLRHHLVVTLPVLVVVPLVPDQVPDLQTVVVVVVERGGGAAERRTVTASSHLRQVERLVLVVQVTVRLVGHGGDIVHARLLRHESEEGSVGHSVVVDCVDFLPVALRLGGRVFVVENEAAGGSRPPLEVEVLLLGTLAVGERSVDGVQSFLFHLKI